MQAADDYIPLQTQYLEFAMLSDNIVATRFIASFKRINNEFDFSHFIVLIILYHQF